MKNIKSKINEDAGKRQVDTFIIPPIPSKWYSRKQGTRHVVDKTLGGDIVYFQGRLPSESWQYWGKRCTLEEWHKFQKTAKAV